MKNFYILGLILIVCALVILPNSAYANVYAMNVYGETTAGSVSGPGAGALIHYTLVDTPTDIAIHIIGPSPSTDTIRTIETGDENPPLSQGPHIAYWNGLNNIGNQAPIGSYSIIVRVNDSVGHASFQQISVDNVTTNSMYGPDGLAVVKNPNSPYFGYILLLNHSTGTSAARVTAGLPGHNEGLYWYNDASLSSEPIAQDTVGLVVFPLSSTDPWDVDIGDTEDAIYVTAFATGDQYDYITQQPIPADPNSVIKIMDFTASTTGGINNFRGTWKIAVSGATSNPGRYIIGVDRNGVTSQFPVRRWTIGATATPFLGAADGAIYSAQDTTVLPGIIYTARAVEMDTAHNIYYCNRRFTIGTQPAFTSYAPGFGLDTSAQPRWNIQAPADLQSFGTPQTAAYRSYPTPVVGFEMGNAGVFLMVNPATGAYLTPDRGTIESPAASGVRDNTFDPAGNLVVSNPTNETVRIFSLPDGPNSFITTSATGTNITLTVPVILGEFEAL